jgi:hypothetical protein
MVGRLLAIVVFLGCASSFAAQSPWWNPQWRFPQANYDPGSLSPENLLANPSFEQGDAVQPSQWEVRPASAVRLERAAHTHLLKSWKVVVDENHCGPKDRSVSISRKIDVRKYAGQEAIFECDLLAERAPHGAPLRIQLEQSRADGSQIAEFAV